MKLIQGALMAAVLVLMSPVFCYGRPSLPDSKISIITIHARRYEFKPSNITLKEGQQVKLVFISDDVTHSLTVEELGLEINIKRNHPNEIFLTPSKPGNFVGECSIYCGAGHDRMKVVFHVEK